VKMRSGIEASTRRPVINASVAVPRTTSLASSRVGRTCPPCSTIADRGASSTRDVEFDPRIVSLADERAADPVDRLPFAFGGCELTELELVDALALEILEGQIAPEKRVSFLGRRHAAGLAERRKEYEGVVAPIPLFDGQDRHSAQVFGGRDSSDRMEPLLDHLREIASTS